MLFSLKKPRQKDEVYYYFNTQIGSKSLVEVSIAIIICVVNHFH